MMLTNMLKIDNACDFKLLFIHFFTVTFPIMH